MNEKSAKIAAAMAAVTQYLEEEQAAILASQQPTAGPELSPVWSSYGRQEIMRMRTMMTMRLFR
jgi:hypothetical protein